MLLEMMITEDINMISMTITDDDNDNK